MSFQNILLKFEVGPANSIGDMCVFVRIFWSSVIGSQNFKRIFLEAQFS